MGKLNEPDKVCIEGQRVHPEPLVLDAFGKPIKKSDRPASPVKPISAYYVKKEKVVTKGENAEQDKEKAKVASVVSYGSVSADVEIRGSKTMGADVAVCFSSFQFKKKGKTVWVGRDGEEVNVETLALQHYEAQGYKGYVFNLIWSFILTYHNTCRFSLQFAL